MSTATAQAFANIAFIKYRLAKLHWTNGKIYIAIRIINLYAVFPPTHAKQTSWDLKRAGPNSYLFSPTIESKWSSNGYQRIYVGCPALSCASWRPPNSQPACKPLHVF